jgi:hypothetical protein
MERVFFAAALLAIIGSSACSPAFKDKRTPSGDFCSDMPIVPAGQEPDREYHRLQPIQSDPKAKTEAERLESLRKAACAIDADAVIEAVNEEIRGDNAAYAMVSSGTAVIWLHHSETTNAPMSTIAPRKVAVPVAAEAPPAPAPALDVAPAPAPVATPAPAPSAKPTGYKRPVTKVTKPLGAPIPAQ